MKSAVRGRVRSPTANLDERSRGVSFDLFRTASEGRDTRQETLVRGERVILDLADYIYAHTTLKPMSKTLFLLSRCLLLTRYTTAGSKPSDLSTRYESLRRELGSSAPDDDFDFAAIVAECGPDLPVILDAVAEVHQLTQGADSLGLVFDTLLRGKFEGGEGLGTFLTPEEVVSPMVAMLIASIDRESVQGLLKSERGLVFGDVCGGTGRFVYALLRGLRRLGVPDSHTQKSARLFDQSRLAVGFGRLNFLFEGIRPKFACVSDSLTSAEVNALRGKCALLATNPPFGSGKYRWSADLAASLSPALLTRLGMRGPNDSADPSELFLFRNLDLLAPGGVLAIVLPDGVLQSAQFRPNLEFYERDRECTLSVLATVSLPASTFALGGTVAKTSFIVIRRDDERSRSGEAPPQLYAAVAEHVGFRKRGNRRAEDPNGNDLLAIATEYSQRTSGRGQWVSSWRSHDRLSPAMLLGGTSSTPAPRKGTLGQVVSLVREYDNACQSGTRFHVSILDIDETGLINVVQTRKNKPVTKGLACRSGDVLRSCLNPKIWRVAVVPAIEGLWTCSAEFVVLRPKRGEDSWRIALALHHADVLRAVQSLVSGTSSSRQRVQKDRIMDVLLPSVQVADDTIRQHAEARLWMYRARLSEALAYEELHTGKAEFTLND